MNEALLKKLQEKKWYLQGFNATPAMGFGAAFSMVKDMPEYLGYGYLSGCFMFFESDVCYYLYAWEDLYAVREELMNRIQKEPSYLDWLHESNEELCREVMFGLMKIGEVDLSQIETNELFALQKEVSRLYTRLVSVSHIIEGFSLTTEEIIREKIKKEFPEDATEKLILLTTPSWHSFLSTEHYELVQIAQKVKANGLESAEQEIIEHTKRYFWKLNSYTSAKILTKEDFTREINELISKNVDLDKIIRDYEVLGEQLEKKKEVMSEVKDQELVQLLTIANVFFRIHDRRKEHMTKSISYIDAILREVSRRFSVPLTSLRYIRDSEFTELPEIESALSLRRKRSVYIITSENHLSGGEVLVGTEADKFFAVLQQMIESTKGEELRGATASLGKATGKVKVCRGENEIQKVEKGDILVACMTQPEFVPAMKLAAAVITDEGGLTSHAAIICRELGIPCIIGTKVATQVLKDGDMVEVDADNGIIKKI